MTGEAKVIVEEVRKLAGRVDDVEKAIMEFKDVPLSDVKKVNDLVIRVGELSGQLKAMRDELDQFKKDLDKNIDNVVAEAVKREMAPILETMQKIEKSGKVTIKEINHNWLAWWPWKKEEKGVKLT